jgi:molybdopterin-containing oxidoreductase family iron-sulfur binding subunit
MDSRNKTAVEEAQPVPEPDRRGFLGKIVAVASAAAAIAIAGKSVAELSGDTADNTPTGPGTVRNIAELTAVDHGENADILVRMQEDLRRALAKPIEQRHWRMVIDTRKCVGCHGCTVACIAENKLPRGVVYRPVMELQLGTYPNLATRFVPRPCMQCENPPCVPVCPVKATYKRPDSIVAVDYDKCIGCAYCVTACPYNARTRDLGENYTDDTPMDGKAPYETAPNFEYGKAWDRSNHKSPVGNVRKCQFCVHRLDEGLLPQCITTCIGRANYFGDVNDPDSLVSQVSASPSAQQLLKEKGTDPNVIYLT